MTIVRVFPLLPCTVGHRRLGLLLSLLITLGSASVAGANCPLPLEGARLSAAQFESALDYLGSEVRKLEDRVPGSYHQESLGTKLAQIKTCSRELRSQAWQSDLANGPRLLTELQSIERDVTRLAGRLGTPDRTIVGIPQAVAPSNDACSAALPLGNSTVTGTMTEATHDGSARCGDSGKSPDIWYRYTAPVTGRVIFDMRGSAFDTVLSLHSGCPGNEANELVCNDDAWGLSSSIARDVTAGEQLLVRVSTFGADPGGNYRLAVSEPGSFSGRVRADGSGAPISALVTPRDSSDSSNARTETDAQGQYTFPDLPSGNYYATAVTDENYIDELYPDVRCLGAACNNAGGMAFAVASLQNTPNIDFSLAPGGSFSGTVEKPNGDPLRGAFVTASGTTGEALSFSDAAGNYTANGLPSDSYFALAQASKYFPNYYDNVICPEPCNSVPAGVTPVPVVVGADRPGVDFRMVPVLCEVNSTTLCLNQGRFKVEVTWDSGNAKGVGSVVPGGSDDSSNVWFFSPDNWEMLIKVLNGCAVNNRYWVFFAATTNVGFEVTVTDAQENQVVTYTNPLGQSADAVTDTSAFATCP